MTAPAALRRLRAVPLALRFLGALLLLETRLRRWDVARVARRYDLALLASPEPAAGDLDPGTLDDAETRELRVLRRVLRLPGVNGTCLRSAILAGRVLRDRRPALVLGVAKAGGVVRAHAWLRVDGRDLDLDRGTGFRPLVVPTPGA
ncbi:lasso peptide biosynthesis B2 protein [Krasilnikoviella flava]|uniref:Transglutaminase-like superfamily protein n=1 Tax=Krasilnikoviella flava TaxID=526729 RepID=A0A1T5IE30_9MICO|nr:lasso peptide biosynthesis B2 protein [Krasilnikoviella flava]SKC37330.1 Transglutaminase-like superfamily protein [Krasilnikoviella flava]